MGNRYGYIRLRKYDRQQEKYLEIMRKHVKVDTRRFEDYSGEKLDQLIEVLEEGDLLYIDDLNSLGRNVSEIERNWKKIAIDLRVRIIVISKPALSCDKPSTLRNAELIDCVLEDVSIGSKLYRRSVQSEGIDRARKEGVRFGRPRRNVPTSFSRMYDDWKKGRITLSEAASEVGVSKSTFYNWTKRYGKDES